MNLELSLVKITVYFKFEFDYLSLGNIILLINNKNHNYKIHLCILTQGINAFIK